MERKGEWLASKMDGVADAFRSLADTVDGWAESLSPTEDEIMIPVSPGTVERRKTRLERETEEFGEEEANLRFRRRIEAAQRQSKLNAKECKAERERHERVHEERRTVPGRRYFPSPDRDNFAALTVAATTASTTALAFSGADS